jgi:hypothetical protein
MSIIGTGIAAGVANTGSTARTQAATQSGRDAQRADSASQTDKLTISQLHDASATRDADEDMPDGQAPGYEDLYEGDAEQEEENANDQIHEEDAPQSSSTNLPLPPSYDPSGKDHPLFHTLNVKA